MGKKNKETLGRSLIKDRFSKNRHRRHVEDNTMLHTTEVNDGFDWGRLNLQSVTAESSLQEFLSTAELAQREFTAEKLNIKYVKSAPCEIDVVTSQPDFSEPLTVPRRPAWRPGISAEEQLIRERDAFLKWRKHLNELQASLGAALTPYERNLELWRQLWRTVERADLALLLLDARNPLLFRCVDLERYAAEQRCRVVLLLNKADLTTEDQRRAWADYFTKENVSIIFFSAAKETAKERKISEESDSAPGMADLGSGSDEEDDSEDEADLNPTEQDIESFKQQLADLDEAVSTTADKLDSIQLTLDKVLEDFRSGRPVGPSPTNATDTAAGAVNNSHEVFDRARLLAALEGHRFDAVKAPPHVTVGLIGYPNVGKSSTVNVLMQTKKVSVSSMPGHTRHVQSLRLGALRVLDCPGLVLPAYAVAPDLLLTAVLPIDQMRAHDAAMARLCELVPRRVFESQYGLLLPAAAAAAPPDYRHILTAHAFNRGFMTAAGQPDVARSARLLLKDAAAGRLRWARPPPGAAPAPAPAPDAAEPEPAATGGRKPTPRETRAVEGWLNKSSELDKAFFNLDTTSAHVKGKPVLGQPAPAAAAAAAAAATPLSKPWKLEKKHANKNKREKLRRVYAHLDEH